ncbi:MAG: isocitrate/isopropylmalate dehydrogenase family protein [Chloroflexi bacterium]|nr:isocitrate/isopropylmalate dehydrogenase family protein [Chloroflexota bacterium]
MSVYNVTCIPGDGIGPEIIAATRYVLHASGVTFNWDIQDAGEAVVEREGTPLPQRVIDAIRRTRVALKGPVTTPVGTGFRSVNVELRKALDLYANLRPCRNLPGVPTRFVGVDLVVVRENTEDLYAGIEFESGSPAARDLVNEFARLGGERLDSDAALSIKALTPNGSRRIARRAFEYARGNGRSRVTAIHKANIMKATDGLFLRMATEVARDYPEITFDHLIVDNACMQLVRRPERFDVLVLPNLYGDIVSDLCAGLVGGLGLAAGANVGDTYAVFEPVHGSAPDIAGQRVANPTAAILSGVLLLQHLGETDAANRVQAAVERVLRLREVVTPDLAVGPEESCVVGTDEFAEAIVSAMHRGGLAERAA